jgi:hypothetical protein
LAFILILKFHLLVLIGLLNPLFLIRNLIKFNIFLYFIAYRKSVICGAILIIIWIIGIMIFKVLWRLLGYIIINLSVIIFIFILLITLFILAALIFFRLSFIIKIILIHIFDIFLGLLHFLFRHMLIYLILFIYLLIRIFLNIIWVYFFTYG